MSDMNWVIYLGPALGAIAFVLIGVAIAGRFWERRKVKQSLIVAERIARQARTKGVVALEDPTEEWETYYDPAVIFGHAPPFSDSELEVLAEAARRQVDGPTSRPYIDHWDRT